MASGGDGGSWHGKGNDDGRVARLVLDKRNARILIGTWNRGATAAELCARYGLPIGSVYRQIHRLEREGLLRVVDTRHGPNGKDVAVYKACLKSLQVQVAGRHMTVWVRADDARTL